MKRQLKRLVVFIGKFLLSFLFHPIKTTKKVNKYISDHFSDYRQYVPSYAPAALTFYVIVLIVPAVSIIAFGASMLHFDLDFVTQLLRKYLTEEYATMLVGIIENPTISLSTIFVLVFSVYAVSRGVGNIYIISKDLFPRDRIENEGIGKYYFYIFMITIFMLVAMIGFLFVLAIGPIGRAFDVFYGFFIFRYTLLFFMVVLFFSLLYFFVPRARLKFSEAFKGALFTTVGMIALYFIISIYFQHASFSNVYGPLASIVMVFFVLNWGCEIFYMGMYVSHLFYTKRKNEYISRVVVDRINHYGQGVVTILNKPCYLYNVMPGEEIEVDVEKEGRREVKGYVADIIKASPSRVDPICVQADMCHDCQLMYMEYFAQLDQKRYEIMRALNRYTRFEYDEDCVDPVMPANVINNYKQYVNYPLYDYDGTVYIGRKTKTTATFMSHCMLQDIMITEAIGRIQDIINDCHAQVYDKARRRGLRQIVVKKIENELVVLFVTGRDGLPEEMIDGIRQIEEVNSLYYSINTNFLSSRIDKNLSKVYGNDYFTYHYQGHTYRLQAGSYVFVSPEMEDNAIQLMIDLIDPKAKIISVFTKTAILELELTNDVIGIGEYRSDIEDANHNAKKRGLTNKRFICDRIDKEVSILTKRYPFDVAIVHLDMRSFTSSLSQAFYDSTVRDLYVISDDPHIFASSLFANDARRIQSRYALEHVYALDKEPYTARVETIFHFRRKKENV